MVGHHDYHGVAITLCKVEGYATGLVESKEIIKQACGIVSVCCPVNLGTLHKEEETVLVLAELSDGCLGHLCQRGLLGGVAVEVVVHIDVAIESPHFIAAVGAHTLDIIAINIGTIGAEVVFAFLGEVVITATDDNVEAIVYCLVGEELLSTAVVVMGGAVGGGSVAILASEHHTESLALQLTTSLEDGGHGSVGAGGVHRLYIVNTLVGGIGGDVCRAAEVAGDIARGSGGGVADGCIAIAGAHIAAEPRVNVEGNRVGCATGTIYLKPARSADGSE